jgi:hypothetical protein
VALVVNGIGRRHPLPAGDGKRENFFVTPCLSAFRWASAGIAGALFSPACLCAQDRRWLKS